MASTVKPHVKNISIYQHADWVMGCQWLNDGVPVDLSGYVLDAMLRASYADAQPAAEFEVATLNAAEGYFELRLTDAQASALSFDSGVYDVRATAGAQTQQIMRGVVKVLRGATRS